MPTLIDRLMARIAAAHAQRVYGKFVAATARAAAVQERILLGKIRCNADSAFGREHAFDRIHSVGEFQRRLPIMSYEDHRPYIDRVKAGDTGAMFGGRQRVRMFALTSGSVDQPKYIPVTDRFLDEYRAGWNAWGIKALLDHPAAILRGIAQVSSRMDESRTESGIACGAITGLIARTQKRLVRKYYVTPGLLAEIDDPAAKYYTIMRLAIPRDVAFVTTASPATQLKLARTGEEHAEAIIRDVHDGTLRADLPVPSHVREQLKPRLQPDAAAAGRLESIIREHGRLLPRHYWNLSFLANWMGGTMGLYLRDFPEYFGDVPVRDVGLLASEGRMSIPIEDGTPAGVLEVTGQFFEFLPADRRDDASPATYLCHQLDPGQEYFILLTTSSGLYRYDLGDLVRVTGYLGQAPIIEFLNKGNHVCSLAGEKLTEHQVVLAMQQASRTIGLHVPNFILAPRWDHPPHYVLHVEALVAPSSVSPPGSQNPARTGSSCVPDRSGGHERPGGHDRSCVPERSCGNPFPHMSRDGSCGNPPPHTPPDRSCGKPLPNTPPDHSCGNPFPHTLTPLAAALERQLCEINIEYASKRHTQRLGPVVLNLLPPGTLSAVDRRLAAQHRKSNEQYKHKYLYCRPGEDDSLVSANTSPPDA